MQEKLLEPLMNQNKNDAINLQNIFLAIVNNIQQIPRGQMPIEQLNIILDQKNRAKDYDQIRSLLSSYLSYPSTYIAQLHMNANRLGNLDTFQMNHTFKEKVKDIQACPCCGFFQQKQTLGLCTPIEEIKNFGVSTCFYFVTMRNIIYLLLVMFFVLSIYSVASNVVASNQYRSLGAVNSTELLSYEGILIISLGSKELNSSDENKTSFNIQCWLGVAMIVLWGIMFLFIKVQQKYKKQQIDRNAITASDFTILIKNYPNKMPKQQLQRQLKKFYTDVGYVQQAEKLKIVKINEAVPFYLQKSFFEDQQLQKYNQESQQFQKKFVSLIKERIQSPRFTTPQQDVKKIKQQYQLHKKKKQEIYNKIMNNIRKQMKLAQQNQTVPAFVTFDSSKTQQFVLQTHLNSHSILHKIFSKNVADSYFHFRNSKNQIIGQAKIVKPSEPQDIIWTNLGQSNCFKFKKRLITFSITFLVLCMSFAVIFGLSKAQTDTNKKVQNDSRNQYISVLISLSISIFNIIIQLILRQLTIIERSETRTQYQTSLGLKAILALLINSILIPILVNYYFKQNLYGVNGLAEDVFYLGITNSFLTPILKFFDGYYYFTRLIKYYKSKPLQKLYLNQNQLNSISQYMQLQLGYEYIYIINLYLFTCFFVPLQPIISIFAIVGLTLMYWSQKFSLFRRCQRPVPGGSQINTAMYQLIYLGPIFYTLGSFCWSHFFPQPQFINIASNLTAAVLSVLIFVIPYKKIIRKIFSFEQQQQRIYSQHRIFLPSEYDRLNPSTSVKAIEQYRNYLAKKKQELKNASQGQIVEFQNRSANLYGIGNRRNQSDFIINQGLFASSFGFNKGTAFNEKNLIVQQILGTQNNAMSPFLLINTVLLDKNQGFNIAVQNWGEGQQVTYQNENNQIPNTLSQLFNVPGTNQNGEQVKYQRDNTNKNDVGYDLVNLMFSHQPNLQASRNIKRSSQRNSKKGYNRNSEWGSNQAPKSLPFNLFGNLLNAETVTYGNSGGNGGIIAQTHNQNNPIQKFSHMMNNMGNNNQDRCMNNGGQSNNMNNANMGSMNMYNMGYAPNNANYYGNMNTEYGLGPGQNNSNNALYQANQNSGGNYGNMGINRIDNTYNSYNPNPYNTHNNR